jgi:hypothetical protein
MRSKQLYGKDGHINKFYNHVMHFLVQCENAPRFQKTHIDSETGVVTAPPEKWYGYRSKLGWQTNSVKSQIGNKLGLTAT